MPEDRLSASLEPSALPEEPHRASTWKESHDDEEGIRRRRIERAVDTRDNGTWAPEVCDSGCALVCVCVRRRGGRRSETRATRPGPPAMAATASRPHRARVVSTMSPLPLLLLLLGLIALTSGENDDRRWLFFVVMWSSGHRTFQRRTRDDGPCFFWSAQGNAEAR